MPGATRSEPDRLMGMAPMAAVVRLAAPTTLVMAVAAVSNVVYTYFVSRLGVEAIGAVSLVFPVSILAITTMVGGIGAGASSAMARALGAGRPRAAAALAGQALLLSGALGIAFGLGMQVAAPALFRVMGASGAVHESASRFARILFGGAVITFVGGMFDSVMRGEGNVRVPAIWSTTSLMLQMVCTPLFMFTFHWGLMGAPIAMLTGQLIAIVPRALWVLGGRAVVRPAFRLPQFTLAPTREILRVGVPAALSMSITNVGLMVLTAVVTRLGDADLAAFGLGTRLDFLLMSFGYGFGAAVLTLVGLATGARRQDRTRAFVMRGGAIAALLLAIPGLGLCWRPGVWLGLFTDDPGIQAVGARYFRLIGPSYPFVGISMIIGFAFQGLGRATVPLVWTCLRVSGVLAAAVICTHALGLGEGAVFASIGVGNVVSAAAMVALFLATERRLRATASAPLATGELASTGVP
ncbi:MAG TPA: MATE family efflux transporter [Candidatus Nitrosopolaris sp.]|nr:MATE family efflux transporter [Candidatus Nitrosopolaris sp.]